MQIKAIKVCGTSMSPFFKDGDIILYEKKELKDILKGDCVVYLYRGRILLHRVIDKFRDNLVISNDDDLDEHIVPFKDVLGKVCGTNFKEGLCGYLCHRILKTARKWIRLAN